MANKPTTASGYDSESVGLARSTCLYVATKLGDLLEDIVIVGGLVPSLIISQEHEADNRQRHVGTMDVDLGLAVAVLDEERYREVCNRLRDAGFEPDVNEEGQSTSQRWKVAVEARSVTVDFLIPPTRAEDKGGRLRNLEANFAAIITPGLELAFQDRISVKLQGMTIFNEQAERQIWVCGPAAFVILKALAFDARGENKDAYDLVYVLQNYGQSVTDVHKRLESLLKHPKTAEGLGILRRDFVNIDSVGPQRVAAFFGDVDNESVRADAAGSVRSLLNKIERMSKAGDD